MRYEVKGPTFCFECGTEIDEADVPCPNCLPGGLRDGLIRADKRMKGREAYEASLKVQPFYHDGTPRKPWDVLPDYAQHSWGKRDD